MSGTIQSERRQRQIALGNIHRKRMRCITLCWVSLFVTVLATAAMLFTSSSFAILISCITLLTAIGFLAYAQIVWLTERDFIDQERSILDKQLALPQYDTAIPVLNRLIDKAA